MRILAMGNCSLDRFLGSGKTRLMWSEGLRKLGHEVEVWEPSQFEWKPNLKRAQKLRFAIGAWSALQKRDLTQFDLIEFYGDEFWLPTWRLAQRPRKARPFLVAHTDGLELLAADRALEFQATHEGNLSTGRKIQDWLHRQTYGRTGKMAFTHADAFVTGCDLDRKDVLERGYYPIEKTEVIPPGLDEEYLSVPFHEEREDRVAFVGTWNVRKGLHHLVPVMREILQERPRVQFDVFGTAGAVALVHEAFPPELRERIHVYKRLPNSEIASHLSKARVFFFPSVYEGFGMATGEAMGCGCAVVTTPTGFGAELRSGEEALICGFEDREAMKQAVLKLLDDPAFCRKIALAGWRRVRELNWPLQIRRLEEIYLKWLGQTGKPA